MQRTGKIPATVITGFLGAGKTSLIRHLMATANGRRLALIINEFGDVGVDAEILEACGLENCGEGDIVELANGCICCTVADDFLPTMQALIDRDEPPDHILIETSGLALPKPLVGAFNWPEVRTRVTVDGVIAVIDGPAVAEGRFAGDPEAVRQQRLADEMLDHDSPLEELYEDQLLCADMVVLNKIDLLDERTRPIVEADLRQNLRPAVKVVDSCHGGIDAQVLLGLEAAAEDDLHNRPSHHDDEAEHDHDDFDSFSIELAEIPSPDALTDLLSAAIADHDILRIKGFVAVAGKDMRLLIQGVGGRLQHYFDRDWRPDEARTGRLVVIGQKGLDRAAITAAIRG
ncbi:MAG: cobalamin biosynthesis protein CobW [Alphaproteobacteria bacterium]|jgi:cobalamin biosynthesis protein CobW|nr:cobalamin biosynthesis protein CobW [Alphaproteobacteria bacterium]MDP6814793.1 cobalamin biosynthesis protein CobW [Alphaproteobacteria bacterium]